MEKDQMREKLKSSLKHKRYEHSLGVCMESVRMAQLFGADTEKAYIAGLLHDCAKCFSRDEEAEWCRRYPEVADQMTLLCHPVLHAPLGAVVARDEYGITDQDILSAIRYHTTACADMKLLDKIIYVADMTEPHRDFDGVDKLRQLAHENIDHAFREAVRQTLLHNIKKGSLIHPDTLDAWNSIVINIKDK